MTKYNYRLIKAKQPYSITEIQEVLDMYETLYNKAKEENVDLIKSDFYRFTGSKEKLKKVYNSLDETNQYYNRTIKPINEISVFNLIMNTWSGIYKREFIEQYHIRHNETPGASFQDNVFWFQTFALAESAYFLNKPFYMNRRDNENSSVKCKGKVYAMQTEYNFILEFLNKNPQIKSKLLGTYYYKKYCNYLGTLHRIDKRFAKEFIEVFRKELKETIEKKEMDWSLPKDFEKQYLELLINNPNKFYYKYLGKYTLAEKIFSIKTKTKEKNVYKVITILGIRIKIRDKAKENY